MLEPPLLLPKSHLTSALGSKPGPTVGTGLQRVLKLLLQEMATRWQVFLMPQSGYSGRQLEPRLVYGGVAGL